jgi:hypothetical protein
LEDLHPDFHCGVCFNVLHYCSCLDFDKSLYLRWRKEPMLPYQPPRSPWDF